MKTIDTILTSGMCLIFYICSTHSKATRLIDCCTYLTNGFKLCRYLCKFCAQILFSNELWTFALLKLARVDVGNTSKKGKNMKGVIT